MKETLSVCRMTLSDLSDVIYGFSQTEKRSSDFLACSNNLLKYLRLRSNETWSAVN